MEKPLLTNADIWSIIKWAAASCSAIGIFIFRFLFSHVYKKLESHDEQLKKIEITLAKISTKLGIEND